MDGSSCISWICLAVWRSDRRARRQQFIYVIDDLDRDWGRSEEATPQKPLRTGQLFCLICLPFRSRKWMVILVLQVVVRRQPDLQRQPNLLYDSFPWWDHVCSTRLFSLWIMLLMSVCDHIVVINMQMQYYFIWIFSKIYNANYQTSRRSVLAKTLLMR